MFTINNYNYECTKQCKNKSHGRIINAAISKRPSISLVCDEKLAAFIAKSCRNFANITDDEVRKYDRSMITVHQSNRLYNVDVVPFIYSRVIRHFTLPPLRTVMLSWNG